MNTEEPARRLTEGIRRQHLAPATERTYCAWLRRYSDGLKGIPFHFENDNAPAPKSKLFKRQLFMRHRRAKAKCLRPKIYSHLPKLRPSSTSRRTAYKRNSRALSSPAATISGLNGVSATVSPNEAGTAHTGQPLNDSFPISTVRFAGSSSMMRSALYRTMSTASSCSRDLIAAANDG
jgi:hypothetical protein